MVMSTINPTQLDVSRVPSEQTKVRRKEGPAPVYSSEAVHPTEPHANVKERRKRKERRKNKLSVAQERRRLIQRRQNSKTHKKAAHTLAAGRGSLIDLEV